MLTASAIVVTWYDVIHLKKWNKTQIERIQT